MLQCSAMPRIFMGLFQVRGILALAYCHPTRTVKRRPKHVISSSARVTGQEMDAFIKAFRKLMMVKWEAGSMAAAWGAGKGRAE